MQESSRPMSLIFAVVAEHQAARARQATLSLSQSLGFHRAVVFAIATSVSELAHNLVFHSGQGGTIVLREVRQHGRVGVEVMAADNGPGIADIGLAMSDGYSTNGGLGGGLPGVRRLMDEFAIHSEMGVGTRVVARKWGR